MVKVIWSPVDSIERFGEAGSRMICLPLENV